MNYRQTEGSATTWRRAYQVLVNNPYGGQPNAIYQEEDRVQMGDQSFSLPGFPSTVTGFFEVDGVIPLRNPETGELLGTSVTHQELQVILFSHYMQLVEQRDAAQSPQETEGEALGGL